LAFIFITPPFAVRQILFALSLTISALSFLQNFLLIIDVAAPVSMRTSIACSFTFATIEDAHGNSLSLIEFLSSLDSMSSVFVAVFSLLFLILYAWSMLFVWPVSLYEFGRLFCCMILVLGFFLRFCRCFCIGLVYGCLIVACCLDVAVDMCVFVRV
jgi:hypothetical protein